VVEKAWRWAGFITSKVMINGHPKEGEKMSGGHFNNDQHRIGQIADEVEHLIEINDEEETDSYGDKIGYFFSQEVIEKFKEAVHILRKAEVMAHRIDWLVSGDDGEDSFLRRWDEDLSKL
jgi:dissimilatory sulfite reductase (desulfoviridin) alpha/beta subunit